MDLKERMHKIVKNSIVKTKGALSKSALTKSAVSLFAAASILASPGIAGAHELYRSGMPILHEHKVVKTGKKGYDLRNDQIVDMKRVDETYHSEEGYWDAQDLEGKVTIIDAQPKFEYRRIRKGDIWGKIALEYHTDWKKMLEFNARIGTVGVTPRPENWTHVVHENAVVGIPYVERDGRKEFVGNYTTLEGAVKLYNFALEDMKKGASQRDDSKQRDDSRCAPQVDCGKREDAGLVPSPMKPEEKRERKSPSKFNLGIGGAAYEAGMNSADVMLAYTPEDSKNTFFIYGKKFSDKSKDDIQTETTLDETILLPDGITYKHRVDYILKNMAEKYTEGFGIGLEREIFRLNGSGTSRISLEARAGAIGKEITTKTSQRAIIEYNRDKSLIGEPENLYNEKTEFRKEYVGNGAAALNITLGDKHTALKTTGGVDYVADDSKEKKTNGFVGAMLLQYF